MNAKTYDGETALMCATENGNMGTVRVLLENGVDVNAKNKDGNTALMIATLAGYSRIAKAFRRAGGKLE